MPELLIITHFLEASFGGAWWCLRGDDLGQSLLVIVSVAVYGHVESHSKL